MTDISRDYSTIVLMEAMTILKSIGSLSPIMQRVFNAVRGTLQAYGTPGIKRRLWNSEFANGRWDCLDSTKGDVVYGFLEKYARGGSILDLGCGSGNTGNELDINAYQHYTGIDIADVAIEKASRKSEDGGRGMRNAYFQSDIFGYVPVQRYDVMLFRDSIYYIEGSKIPKMLQRYTAYLKEGGVFIVRMWNGAGRFQPIVDAVEAHFQVLEKQFFNQPDAVVIVFRERR